MILVDTNVLMYAAGLEHPHKARSARFVDKVAAGEIDAALDAEALQEIIHRYRAVDRWLEGRELFIQARGVFRDILPITGEVMDRAGELVDAYTSLSARDAIHAAVVMVYGLEGICTFDRDFARIKGIRLISP